MHLKQPVNNAFANASTDYEPRPANRKLRPTYPSTTNSTAPNELSMRASSSPPVDSSFHDAIWPVLAVAQFYAMMPIYGVRCGSRKSGGNADDGDNGGDGTTSGSALRFRWRSLRVVWTLLYMAVGWALMYLYWKRLHETGVTAKNIGNGIYFLNSLLFTAMFFRLSGEWAALIAKWTQTERPFLRAPYHRVGRMSLPTRIRVSALCLFMLCAGDSIISTTQSIVNYRVRVAHCQWSDTNHLQRYFTIGNMYIFKHIRYSHGLAIVKTMFDVVNMMGGSYGNMFVMLVSIGLSTRFRQIAERLRIMPEGTISESTWAQVRVHYAQLCELVEMVNVALAPIILLTCANNLYFICYQLLNCFQKFDHLINYAYYWYSLIYLIIRTVGLFLCAAAVHDAAWSPVEVIRTVPSSAWNIEVERFFNQIVGERPSLTGMKFFHLTRNNLLTMIGTIVTYELVLMQFAENTKKIDAVSDTGSGICSVWNDADAI